jgi:hypothetical protein
LLGNDQSLGPEAADRLARRGAKDYISALLTWPSSAGYMRNDNSGALDDGGSLIRSFP